MRKLNWMRKAFAGVVGGALLCSFPAFAREGMSGTAAPSAGSRGSGDLGKSFVGGLLGYSSASDEVGSGLGFGIRGGYFLADPWGAGLFLQSGDHDRGISSLTIGLEGIYKLDQFAPGVSAAVDLAASKFSGSGFEGDYHVAIGGRVAYDYKLPTDTPLTAGVDVSLLFTKPGTSMLTLLNVQGTVKFWF